MKYIQTLDKKTKKPILRIIDDEGKETKKSFKDKRARTAWLKKEIRKGSR